MSSASVLSTLLDPGRLVVAGRLVESPQNVDDLVDATGLDRRSVLEALASLHEAGLVRHDTAGYRIEERTLRDLARECSDNPDVDPFVRRGMTDDEADVLARFFRGRTLVEVPTQRAKRLVVLERLALEFEIGRRYPESEVNEVLGRFHADVAALRRYLVDDEFLDRSDSLYWRSGGRTDA
ncbi:DUF2087 domain-containing protein [Ilumatobacter nonamiensis]|uniref:DUF2087 domain-containing protein n=1 Tax=Ilumatobacter nonamiensis TaxID=467093 RepID=UPI0019D368DF|nr:DUF2087 domain-containing protein [Ilumatobacter nonamiensis]